jgi:hypothetical protein
MSWFDTECRPFDLYDTDDGLYYQAVGTEDNPERIEAIEIISFLDKIAANERKGNNRIKGIRIYYGNIDGDLDVGGAENILKFYENCFKYIKLPNVRLIFQNTFFSGKVDFSFVHFGEITNFHGVQFREDCDFTYAQFGAITDFGCVRFGERTKFIGTQFGEKTDFSYAQFGEKTNFGYAQFGEITRFTGARLGKGVFVGIQ